MSSRHTLEVLIGILGIMIVLVPAISIALAVLTALALSYFSATLLFATAISVRIFGGRLLRYLQNKLNSIKH